MSIDDIIDERIPDYEEGSFFDNQSQPVHNAPSKIPSLVAAKSATMMKPPALPITQLSIYKQLPASKPLTALKLDKRCLLSARVINQVESKFILITVGRVLCAVDQHAAHERINLETLENYFLRHRELYLSETQFKLTRLIQREGTVSQPQTVQCLPISLRQAQDLMKNEVLL